MESRYRHRAASAVMFTLDGVPLLYNGMEVGDTVESLAPALFEHAPIQWQVAERRPHVEAFYRQLAQATGRQPLWNFHKYLVGRDGKVIANYTSMTGPDDARLVRDIEKQLAAK